MKSHTALIMIALVCFFVCPGECGVRRRMKRRLDEFGEMILLKTDKNPLDFNGYGNWCGYGGKGDTVDDIDGCCMVHDKCYSHVNRDECQTWLKYKVYTTEYRWSFHNGVITCRDEDTCAMTLCECDRSAALCFAENIGVYDKANKHSGIMKGISRLVGMNSRR